MFLWDWFKSVLSYLGLFNQSGKLMFLGLDQSGKTTLLHMLKDNKMSIHEPTLSPTLEILEICNKPFTIYDFGGHGQQVKLVWKDFFPGVNGIVFCVDAAYPARFMEAKEELDILLRDERVINVPFLVLGTKIDSFDAVSEDEIRKVLKIRSTGKGQVPIDTLEGARPIELFMCSVLTKQGYDEAFRWFSQYI